MCAERMPRDEGVPVSVATLAGVSVVVPVCSYMMVADVRRVLLGYVECCYVTQYVLSTQDGQRLIDTKPVLEQIRREGARPMGLQMSFAPYCYRGIREHIAQTRLLFTGTATDLEMVHAPAAEPMTPDTETTAWGKGYPWFCRDVLASYVTGIEGASLFDVDADMFPFAATPNPTSMLRAATHTSVAAQDSRNYVNLSMHMADPLPSARLRGDILYLTIEFQRCKYGVAASARGFYLLESSDLTDPTPKRDFSGLVSAPATHGTAQKHIFPTLLGLLCHYIPAFKKQTAEALRATTARCRYCEEKDVFEAPGWLLPAPTPPPRDLWRTTEHEYRINQPQDPRVPQRNWGANWVFPPDEAAMEQVYQEFVRCATEAVMLSVDGTLVPLDASVPFDQRVFVSNGIVVAFCRDTATPSASHITSLPTPTWAEARSELSAWWVLIPWLLWRSIHTLPVACIDYHGYRAWCVAHSPDVIDRFGSAASFLNTYRILTPEQNRQPCDTPLPQADTLRALAHVVDDLRPHIAQGVYNSVQSALLATSEHAAPHENVLRTYRGRDGRVYAEGFAALASWRDRGAKRAALAELAKKLPFCAPDAFPTAGGPPGGLETLSDSKPLSNDSAFLPLADAASSCGTNEATTEEATPSKAPLVCNDSSEGSSLAAEDGAPNRVVDPSDGEERSSTQSERACVREDDDARCGPVAPHDGTLDDRVARLGVDVREGRVVLSDPNQVRETLHARGIPMRAIGRVLKEVKGVVSAERTLVLEGVIRSAKRELRALLRERRAAGVADDVAGFLNELFAEGSCLAPQAKGTTLRTTLLERLNMHFNIVTDEYADRPQHPLWYAQEDDKLYVLRGLCLSVGLRILSRVYVWSKPVIFRKADVLDLVAIPQPPSRRAGWDDGLEESVKLSKHQQDYRTAALQLKHLCHDLARRYQWDSAVLIPPLHALAQLALLEGDQPQATSLYARCVSIARLNGGVASADYQSSLLNYSMTLLRGTAQHGVPHAASPTLPPHLDGIVHDLRDALQELLAADATSPYGATAKTHIRHLTALQQRLKQ